MSSTSTRKQLGPARKRLKDRLKEVTDLIQNGDVVKLKQVRSRFMANMEYHSKLSCDLANLLGTTGAPDEEVIIEKEVNDCTELTMDANEIYADLIEILSGIQADRHDDNVKRKESEKLDREIEKLKVETEYARAQLDKIHLKDEENKIRVKLPTLTLQSFTGKVTEWPGFWDSFNATINSNNGMSKVDKFKYLLSTLQGDAKESLRGFNITDAHYEEAIKHLKSRYDDKGYIIQSYYENLSSMTKSTNATSDLRKKINLIETQLRSLESMGEQIENNYIVSLIKSKLPANFNLKLEESKSGDWTVKNLRESINKLIAAKERSEEYPDNFGNYEYSSEGMFNRDIKVKCLYCEKSHWSDECQRYKTLTERKGQLRGRCFVCLSDKHRYRECTSYKACFYCKRKGNHHQSLCPEKFSYQHPNENNEINDISGIGDEISVKVNDQVIMKSAQINIRNQLNGKECHANILLDTGAKRTYITVEKAKLLGLKMGPLKTVRLNTFGSVAPNNIPTNETKLSIKHKDGTYKLIYAKVCKTITGPMKRQHLDVGKYKHIWKELEMVSKIESKNGSYNIDLLIGSDYYEDHGLL